MKRPKPLVILDGDLFKNIAEDIKEYNESILDYIDAKLEEIKNATKEK